MTARSTTAPRREAKHDAIEASERIRQKTEDNVAYYALAGHEAIERRLEELDREWSLERVLGAKAAGLSLLGFVMGATRSRLWYLLPALVSGFVLQHAVQGWSPPAEMLRNMGFRTSREIEEERYALKALRGDFKDIPPLKDEDNRSTIQQAIQSIRR